MEHKMRLHNDPFIKIKNGTKTVELRLNDEKRSLVKIGDTIEFTNRSNEETIIVDVIDIKKYNSFEELYSHFNKIEMGYNEEDIIDPKDMEKYYTKEEQDKYGVLGIVIKIKED
ncbi:MAG: ASCH domain-containing protein [bacterium]|nr:ASCH domain-containing protein [bacterium]